LALPARYGSFSASSSPLLSSSFTIASPRFSPDGQRVLFVSPGGPPTDEQGYPITQGQQSPLERVLALFEPPAAEAHGAKADLWVVNVDGTGLRRLTTLHEDSPMGIFSPDGQRIVILAAGGIYTLNADGSGVRKLAPSGDHGGLDWGQR
jgi:Tol biopolymer transport system component